MLAGPANAPLARLRDNPRETAILCDIDGTLAPIVPKAEDALVPERTRRVLARLVDRFGAVACVSGRSAAQARMIVSVPGIIFRGNHGMETLDPGREEAVLAPEAAAWKDQMRRFAASVDRHDLRDCGVYIDDKGTNLSFHTRRAPDQGKAMAALKRIEPIATEQGLRAFWGRKILEVKPPIDVNKGTAAREIVLRAQARFALFGGDDTTDLDAFSALRRLQSEGLLEAVVLVGVHSDEAPPTIIAQSDIVVDGPEGFAALLESLVGE